VPKVEQEQEPLNNSETISDGNLPSSEREEEEEEEAKEEEAKEETEQQQENSLTQ